MPKKHRRHGNPRAASFNLPGWRARRLLDLRMYKFEWSAHVKSGQVARQTAQMLEDVRAYVREIWRQT